MRPFLHVLLALVLVSALAACGGGATEADGDAQGPGPNPNPDPNPGPQPQPQIALIEPALGYFDTTTPDIAWTPVADADEYELIVSEDAPGNDVVADLRTAQTTAGFPAADGQELFLRVRALKAGQPLAESPVEEFVVRLPPDFAENFRLVLDDAAQSQGGFKLVTLVLADGPWMLLLDGQAKVKWWYRHSGSGSIHDARVLPNGNLLFNVVGASGQNNRAYEMTFQGDVVWESATAESHHEVGLGPGGHALCLTWTFDDWDGNTYEGDGLELFDRATGQRLWSWDIFDHYAPEDWPVNVANQGLSGRGVDWSHSNAAVWDAARSVIWVSVRNFDQIIGVDYPGGDVRIVLGKDGLGEGLFSHCHAPEVQADGSLLLWDNGNGFNPRVSHAKVIEFDENAGTASLTFSWTDDPPIFNPAVGDADRLPNGNVLVTAGTTRRLIEVTQEGEKVWEATVDNESFWFYRAEQIDASLVPSKPVPIVRD